MTITIAPKSGGATRRPRDILDLTGSWDLSVAPKTLQVRLFWYTEGKGTGDVGIVETQTVDFPGRASDRTFKFPLPSAPYSYSGRLITIKWAVELIADDAVARWEFTMSPSGAEVSHPGEVPAASR